MRAYRGHTEGKNFVWKIYCFFPLNLRVLPADSDGSICKKWMQNALRFVMKNRSFSSLKNNFKIRIKSYLSKRKNFYFSSEIWGRFAFTFCRYFHQNLQVLPSESVAGNTLRFRGKKQYIFQTKFFPLEFEGILYNSVGFSISTIIERIPTLCSGAECQSVDCASQTLAKAPEATPTPQRSSRFHRWFISPCYR